MACRMEEMAFTMALRSAAKTAVGVQHIARKCSLEAIFWSNLTRRMVKFDPVSDQI